MSIELTRRRFLAGAASAAIAAGLSQLPISKGPIEPIPEDVPLPKEAAEAKGIVECGMVMRLYDHHLISRQTAMEQLFGVVEERFYDQVEQEDSILLPYGEPKITTRSPGSDPWDPLDSATIIAIRQKFYTKDYFG